MGGRSSSSSQWRAGCLYGELRTGDSKNRSVMIAVYQRAVAAGLARVAHRGPPAMWGAGWSRRHGAFSNGVQIPIGAELLAISLATGRAPAKEELLVASLHLSAARLGGTPTARRSARRFCIPSTLVGPGGIEPPTDGLKVHCSAAELRARSY